jgi:hypothetical protein
MLKGLMNIAVSGVFCLAGLAACDRVADRMFESMGSMGEERVQLVSKPFTLGPKPLHVQPNQPLRVMGLTNDLCLELSDQMPEHVDEDAAYEAAMSGAKVTAILTLTDGKRFSWTCDGWMLGGGADPHRMNRLFACMRSECNDPSPAKGSRIASIELASSEPLRVLGVSWESNDHFDHLMQPPPDQFATNSSEYRLLEKSFSTEPAWAGPARPVSRLHLQMRATRGSTDYRSTIGLRVSGQGIQLEPLEDAHGMDLVTVPSSAVQACGMSSFGPKAQSVELYLNEQGIQLAFLNNQEVLDWCWQQRIPMVSHAAAAAWEHDGTPFPPRQAYAEQLASKDAYYRQAHRSAAGY